MINYMKQTNILNVSLNIKEEVCIVFTHKHFM